MQPMMGMHMNMGSPRAPPGVNQRNMHDWQCPNTECINNKKMVFSKHDACPACGSPKPETFATRTMGEKPGDWKCPNTGCLNHTKMVFGKHAHCPACGSANP